MPSGLELTGASVFSRWRYLLWFWLAILAVATAGGVVLQRLGPPPEQVARGQARSGPQASAGSVKPTFPVVATAAAPLMQPEPPERLPRTPTATGPTEPAPSSRASIVQNASSLAGSEADERRAGLPAEAQATGRADNERSQPRSEILVTLHPAASDQGKALSEQLASQAGLAPGQIATGPVGDLRSGAVIRFYSAADHALARRLGKELTRMGYAWRLENLSDRPSPPRQQGVEVWLPGR